MTREPTAVSPGHADPRDDEAVDAAALAGHRAAMIATIEAHARVLERVFGRDGLSPRVLEAMRQVPRHRFAPKAAAASAYDDRPIRIGAQQTISQPFIVAAMTHLIDPQPTDRVLEVGTGSGYQAAVLSPLVAQVYTIEVAPGLAAQAAARLSELGYANVETRSGDGYAGWPKAAPFDAILVTAGADDIPPPLLDQLKPGGRMIIPLGWGFDQDLSLVTKADSGEVTCERLFPVSFVRFART